MSANDRVTIMTPPNMADGFEEYHFTPLELAARWRTDVSTIRAWFLDEPGVLRYSHNSVNSRKRPYINLRIPENVARRVYAARMCEPKQSRTMPVVIR